MRRSRRLPVAALVLATAIVRGAGAQSPPTIPGLRYTMTITTVPHGSTADGVKTQRLIAHVLEAAGRGRMDIIDGTFGEGFGKGDYLLFDSTEFLIVRPGSREFSQVPAGLATKSIEMLQSLPGVQVAVNDVKVSLDTIRRVDTIENLPTRHYRLAVAYDIALDAGVMKESIATEVRSDFWMADIPGFPPSPFSQVTVGGGAGKGALKEMMDKVAAAAGALRRGVPVKSVSVSRMIEGSGPPVETEQTMQVSGYQRTPVDQTLLMLPTDYRETSMPGLEDLPGVSSESDAKWRKPPSAGR